jgi:uroporphyrinogen decarboxylase
MTSRERILAVLNRRPVDRLPVDLWHTDEVFQALVAHFGALDDLDLYGRMGIDKIVWVFPIYRSPDHQGPTGSLHFGDAPRSMWGTPLRPIQAGQALYHEFAQAPLAEYETPESLERYPFWPDPDCVDYQQMTSLAQRAATDFVVVGPWVSFFEVYCQMRGLETALMDVIANPDLVETALDYIEARQTSMMKRFLDQAAPWVDMVFISDDMGCQNNLLLSLELWDRYFRHRLKRWCELVHGYGRRVFYHSDGAIEPLIPRLIDCGVDVLNPIQHACPGMDPAELKRKYGHQIVFHGGIDNQQVLPRGTPDDVRAETRRCIQTLGAGREGYIVCSCHNIQPGTPIDNILAMVETALNDG